MELANILIDDFLNYGDYITVESINNGGCGEFAFLLNEMFKKNGLTEFRYLSTFNFISVEPPDGFSGDCEYMDDWNLDVMNEIGVPCEYFESYKRTAIGLDNRKGVIGYHVWLFDGRNHYDATCLYGVENPLELPFFQIFVS